MPVCAGARVSAVVQATAHLFHHHHCQYCVCQITHIELIVNVGAVLQQSFHYFCVPVLTGSQESCASVLWKSKEWAQSGERAGTGLNITIKKEPNFKTFQNLAHSSSVMSSYWIFHNFNAKCCHMYLSTWLSHYIHFSPEFFLRKGQELRKFCFLFLIFFLAIRSFAPFTTPSLSTSLHFTAKFLMPAKLFHRWKDSTPFHCSRANWPSALFRPKPCALFCPAPHLWISGLKLSREKAF